MNYTYIREVMNELDLLDLGIDGLNELIEEQKMYTGLSSRLIVLAATSLVEENLEELEF